MPDSDNQQKRTLKEEFLKIVSREVVGGDWRSTWYERANGSRFNVMLPPRTQVKPPTYQRSYDEDAEAEMRDRLAYAHASTPAMEAVAESHRLFPEVG